MRRLIGALLLTMVSSMGVAQDDCKWSASAKPERLKYRDDLKQMTPRGIFCPLPNSWYGREKSKVRGGLGTITMVWPAGIQQYPLDESAWVIHQTAHTAWARRYLIEEFGLQDFVIPGLGYENDLRVIIQKLDDEVLHDDVRGIQHTGRRVAHRHLIYHPSNKRVCEIHVKGTVRYPRSTQAFSHALATFVGCWEISRP